MRKVPHHKALKILAAHAVIAIIVVVYSLFLGCPFRRFLGIPCPGCGMTRAYVAFFTGHIRAAFACHPLFLLALPLIFFFLHINVFNFHVSKNVQNGIAIAAIVLFFGVYILRVFILHDPVLKVNFDSSVLGRLF